METINYILAVLVTFLSLFLGVVLARLTKEELKPGEKYFKFLKYIFLIAVIFISLYVSISNKDFIIFAIVLVISLYLLFYKKKQKETYIYALLGFIIYYSSSFINLFLLESALIFLYGLPTGTLITKGMIKKQKRLIVKEILITTISYPLIAIILFLITTFLF
jgi:hypothetical protein